MNSPLNWKIIEQIQNLKLSDYRAKIIERLCTAAQPTFEKGKAMKFENLTRFFNPYTTTFLTTLLIITERKPLLILDTFWVRNPKLNLSLQAYFPLLYKSFSRALESTKNENLPIIPTSIWIKV